MTLSSDYFAGHIEGFAKLVVVLHHYPGDQVAFAYVLIDLFLNFLLKVLNNWRFITLHLVVRLAFSLYLIKNAFMI